MFENIALSAILIIVSVLLVSELYVFWDNRSLWGNLLVTLAVGFTVVWFLIGLTGAW